MRVLLDTTALNWLTDNTELAEEFLRAWQAGRVEVMVTPEVAKEIRETASAD